MNVSGVIGDGSQQIAQQSHRGTRSLDHYRGRATVRVGVQQLSEQLNTLFLLAKESVRSHIAILSGPTARIGRYGAPRRRSGATDLRHRLAQNADYGRARSFASARDRIAELPARPGQPAVERFDCDASSEFYGAFLELDDASVIDDIVQLSASRVRAACSVGATTNRFTGLRTGLDPRRHVVEPATASTGVLLATTM